MIGLWVETNSTMLGQVNSPPILVYFSGWIGMFAGGMIGF